MGNKTEGERQVRDNKKQLKDNNDGLKNRGKQLRGIIEGDD